MNKYQTYENNADALIRQAAEEIRKESVLPMPKMPAIQLPEQHVASVSNSSSRKLRGRTLAAVAATIAFLCFLVWPQSTQSAFARMQKALESVKSISYAVLDYHADGKEYETRVTVVEPNLSRADSSHGGTQIFDWNQGLSLSIDDSRKTATFAELSPSVEITARRHQFLTMLREVPEHAIEHLGQLTWNDQPAEAFMMPFGDRIFRVIVDSATGLPVRMEYDGTVDGLPGFTEVFTDFVFDARIDATLFAMDVPEGYQVTQHELDEPAAWAGLLTVSTGNGLNDLAFGSSRQAIIDFLGEPEITSTRHATETLSYNQLGLEIFLHSENGMRQIRCQSQARRGASVHDFVGQTAEGIGMGDTLDDVVAAYGKPDLLHRNVANYIRLGWQFYLQENRVVGITVGTPLHDWIDFEVNEADGSYSTFVKDE